MDDFTGILILLGLAVLTVPLLLVVALVKIGNAKARIDALERDVQRLQARVLNVESARLTRCVTPATRGGNCAASCAAIRPRCAARGRSAVCCAQR